jgi:protein TonB
MPRTFTLVSVSIHAVVLGGVYVAQTLSSGPLPMLRDALAFADSTIRPVTLVDPPPPRLAPRAESPEQSVSASAAPLDAPATVTPETGRENEKSQTRSSGPITGVEQGGDISASIGVLPGANAALPEPAPQQPVRPGGGIKPPRKIVDVKPIYPELALTARQTGVVILETIIDAQGRVETVRVLRGYSLLNQAAIDAVKQWRFTPTLLNGEPVPIVMTVTVNFELKD